MKKTIRIFCIFAICSAALVGCKKVVTLNELPPEAQAFISANFPDVLVSYAEREGCEYEVVLFDGTELEFSKDGAWKKVDMKHSAVPAAVVASLPAPAAAYLDSSFPGIQVEKVKIERRRYTVELLNGIELEFDSNGVCREIDD